MYSRTQWKSETTFMDDEENIHKVIKVLCFYWNREAHHFLCKGKSLQNQIKFTVVKTGYVLQLSKYQGWGAAFHLWNTRQPSKGIYLAQWLIWALLSFPRLHTACLLHKFYDLSLPKKHISFSQKQRNYPLLPLSKTGEKIILIMVSI